MYLENAKKIFIRKTDLVKLGLSVGTAKDLIYKESLKPYEVMRYFSLETAIAFLLGVHPRDQNLTNYNNYYPTEEALLKAIEKGELPDSKIINWGDWDHAAEATIDRISLEKWAKYYGYKWVLPPYKPFNPNSMPTEQENTTIDELKQQLAEAKSEIANLKKLETSCQTVNCDEFSIYGYTSENLKLVFDVIKKLAPKVDKENLHSYPTKEELKAFVKKYLNDNDKLAEAIYQIVIPENVKNRGRTPKGVETFKGFL